MTFTLLEQWLHMGLAARLIAGTLLAMCVASIVVVTERLVSLTASSRQSMVFARQLANLLSDGDIDRAAQASLPESAGHLGRVLNAALRVYRSAPAHDPELTFESVARVLERQARRELHNMKRGQGVFATVAWMAPLLGLLGTVLGIVSAFQEMAHTGAGGLATMWAGIAEALATTALGIVVAIPALGAYNGLEAWTDARSVDIAEASNELLDLLARHLRKTRPVRVSMLPPQAVPPAQDGK